MGWDGMEGFGLGLGFGVGGGETFDQGDEFKIDAMMLEVS